LSIIICTKAYFLCTFADSSTFVILLMIFRPFSTEEDLPCKTHAESKVR
jgi:hypothetical protein